MGKCRIKSVLMKLTLARLNAVSSLVEGVL